MRVVLGYGIFPSKDMRKACRALDIKEGGDKTYRNGDNGFYSRTGDVPADIATVRMVDSLKTGSIINNA